MSTDSSLGCYTSNPGYLNRVLGTWSWPDPASAIMAFWGVSQWMEDLCLSLSLQLCLSKKGILRKEERREGKRGQKGKGKEKKENVIWNDHGKVNTHQALEAMQNCCPQRGSMDQGLRAHDILSSKWHCGSTDKWKEEENSYLKFWSVFYFWLRNQLVVYFSKKSEVIEAFRQGSDMMKSFTEKSTSPARRLLF